MYTFTRFIIQLSIVSQDPIVPYAQRPASDWFTFFQNIHRFHTPSGQNILFNQFFVLSKSLFYRQQAQSINWEHFVTFYIQTQIFIKHDSSLTANYTTKCKWNRTQNCIYHDLTCSTTCRFIRESNLVTLN